MSRREHQDGCVFQSVTEIASCGQNHTVIAGSNELGWQTLAQRRDVLSRCQIYKMVNHLGCLVFEDFLAFNKLFRDCTCIYLRYGCLQLYSHGVQQSLSCPTVIVVACLNLGGMPQ